MLSNDKHFFPLGTDHWKTFEEKGGGGRGAGEVQKIIRARGKSNGKKFMHAN